MQAAVVHGGALFVQHISLGIAGVGKGQPKADDFAAHVHIAHQTAGHGAAIAVDVYLLTARQTVLVQGPHLGRGPASAFIGDALRGQAFLIHLGRVNAVQADAGCAHVDGIGVDHPHGAGECACPCHHGQEQENNEGPNS